MSELVIADRWGRALPASSHFKKAASPVTGNKFGKWAGEDTRFLQLPGGAMLQFDLSKLTLADYRGMRDNYQLNSSLMLLTFMLHQQDWHIECEDKKIADTIEEIMRSVWTRLIRALSQSFWAGFSPTVIEWGNDTNSMRVVIDRFKDLVPEDCTVNWKAVDGWAPPGMVKPKLYEYDGIKQRGGLYPIPAENTIWYPLLMENGDYYGRKLLKPAFPSWFFSTLIHLFANRYYERFGEPLPIGRADFDANYNINGTETDGRTTMENILSAIRSRAVAVLPSDRDGNGNYDFDLEYLESQMRGADFERYMARLDEEMSLALFTPILLMRTGEGGGSYNLGVSHLQTWLWCLNAVAGDWKEYIDRYVVERIKAYNFSPKAPRAEWVPRQLGKDNSEALRAIATAMVTGGQAKPDLDEMGQALGMKFEEIKQVAMPPAAPGDPNQPPGAPGQPATGPGSDTRQRQKPTTAVQRPGGGPAKP